MRTTVTLPEPLLENAKRFAEERQMTLSALVEDALRCRLSEKASPSRPEFRLYTVRGKLADPALDLNRTSVLLTDDEAEHFLNANARR
jgi:hypothetical protein